MQSGLIVIIKIQRQKGFPFELVQSIVVEAGKGIVGDCHCDGGDKQIALISSETKAWMAEQEAQGLCFSRFQENIETKGIDYSHLSSGNILRTEHTLIEITENSKRCFPECRRIQDKLPCDLKTGTAFAKVVQSGMIQVGERLMDKY